MASITLHNNFNTFLLLILLSAVLLGYTTSSCLSLPEKTNPTELTIGTLVSSGLKAPSGVRVERNGNIYVADTENSSFKIIEVLPFGELKTSVLTGSGISGVAVENVSASQAQYASPRNLDFGNKETNTEDLIFLTDSNNHRIRILNKRTGLVSTFAGTELGGYNNDSIPAVKASLFYPAAVLVYGNDLFISDTYNQRIRKVSLKSGIISTVVGTGISGLSGDGGLAKGAKIENPHGMAVLNGELYFADTNNHRIRKVNLTSGVISTVAGSFAGDNGAGVEATSAQLFFPKDILFYNEDLYIADTANNKIRKVSKVSNQMNTVPQTSTGLNSPESIALQITSKRVSLLIADSGNNRIQSIDRVCPSGYLFDSSGVNCVATCNGIPIDDPSVCSSHGKCSNSTCECDKYYFGPNCNVTSCGGIFSNSSSVCEGNGVCTFYDHCECNGYTGTTCQTPVCFGKTSDNGACNRKGNCEAPDQCSCWDEFTGNQCQIPLCNGVSAISNLVCSGHGSCNSPNNCSCSSNFIGLDCEFELCLGKPTSAKNNGSSCTISNPSTNDAHVQVDLVSDLKDLSNKKITFERFQDVRVQFPSNFYLSNVTINNLALVSSVFNPQSGLVSNLNMSAHAVISSIIDISILSIESGKEVSVHQLKNPIEIYFWNLTSLSISGDDFKSCMYFDEPQHKWKTDGVTTILTDFRNISGLVTFSLKCQTVHLTSFAIIDQNVKKSLSDPQSINTSLSTDQIVGIVVGIVGALLMIGVVLLLSIIGCSLLICSKLTSDRNRKKFDLRVQQNMH